MTYLIYLRIHAKFFPENAKEDHIDELDVDKIILLKWFLKETFVEWKKVHWIGLSQDRK
jgi:hypothetical protein